MNKKEELLENVFLEEEQERMQKPENIIADLEPEKENIFDLDGE